MRTHILTLAAMAFVITGCAEQPERVYPALKPNNAGFSGCSQAEETVDELIANGSFNLIYGTIERVEPVLDLFNYSHSSGGVKECDTHINPNIQITLRIERAAWDWAEAPIVHIGFLENMLHQLEATPIYDRQNGLRWSDGKKYFKVGSRVGAAGSFTADGYFLTQPHLLFELRDDRIIDGFPTSPCYEGSMNGLLIDEVIEKTRTARGNERPMLTSSSTGEIFSLPLFSICTENMP